MKYPFNKIEIKAALDGLVGANGPSAQHLANLAPRRDLVFVVSAKKYQKMENATQVASKKKIRCGHFVTKNNVQKTAGERQNPVLWALACRKPMVSGQLKRNRLL